MTGLDNTRLPLPNRIKSPYFEGQNLAQNIPYFALRFQTQSTQQQNAIKNRCKYLALFLDN